MTTATKTKELTAEQRAVAEELHEAFYQYIDGLLFAVRNELAFAQWYRADITKDVLKLSGAKLSMTDLIEASSVQKMPPLFARLWSPEDGDRYNFQDFLDNELKILRAEKLIARYDAIYFTCKADWPMPAKFTQHFTAWLDAKPKDKQRMTALNLSVADIATIFDRDYDDTDESE